MASAPPDEPGGLPPDVRHRIQELIRAELARACATATARGVPAAAVAESLEERTTRLNSPAPVEDGQDRADDPVHLGRVLE